MQISQRLEFESSESGYNLAEFVAARSFEYSSIEFELENSKGIRSKKSDKFVNDFFSSLCQEENLALGLDGHSSKLYEVINFLKAYSKEDLIALTNDRTTINKCGLARYVNQ